MIIRRAALLGAVALLGAPPTASAQQPGKVYRIGMLETISAPANTANLSAFRQGLREHGYAEGKNLAIEYRSADGSAERFPALAAELVRMKVDLIVTRGTPAAMAAKSAAGPIPVVMAAIGEPLNTGVIASLARPGGNVTGLSAFVSELEGKRVELLREAVPKIRQVAALFNMGNPVAPPQWKEIETGARALGLTPLLADVRKREDLAPALEGIVRQGVDGMVVGIDALTQANRVTIADFAAKQRLPTIYASREFVDVGGLMSYGVSYPHLYRRAATFIDKIFKGARPGDLPVEQPIKFELVINLRTAKAIGVSIPTALLLRADEILE